MEALRQEFLNASQQALAREGDVTGQGLAAMQRVAAAPEDTMFDEIWSAVSALPKGFFEGYTTISVGDAPKNKAAEILRGIGQLWGFIGFVPDPTDLAAAPAKAALLYGKAALKKRAAGKIVATAVKKGVTTEAAALAAKASTTALIKEAERVVGLRGYGDLLGGVLAGKSIPLGGATLAMKGLGKLTGVPFIANGGRAAVGLLKNTKAFSSAERFGILTDVGQQALHLGLASSIAGAGINPMKWGERVDSAIGGFAGGAVMGGAFGLLGNVGRVSSKLILEGKQSSAEHLLRAFAGGVMMGLPATMRGDDTANQVYEYLLGGYFGLHATPWVVNAGRGAANEAFNANIEGAKDAIAAKDYNRFANTIGVMDIRAQSKTAGDIMMRESLQFHGLEPAEVSKIMRDGSWLVPKKVETPPVETPPADPQQPPSLSAEQIRVRDEESARLTREVWDAEYKNITDQASEWRRFKAQTAAEVAGDPASINIEWSDARTDLYTYGARQRANLTNRSLIDRFGELD